jgi:hypothetical protein
VVLPYYQHKVETDKLVEFYRTFDVKKVKKAVKTSAPIGKPKVSAVDIGIINLTQYQRNKKSPYSADEMAQIKERNAIIENNNYTKQQIKRTKDSATRKHYMDRMEKPLPLSNNIVRQYNLELNKSGFKK